MPVNPQATIYDVLLEFNVQSGNSPFSIWNVGGVTSGQIYDRITEANATLQGWIGSTVSGDAVLNEQVKRFEVNYGSARLAASLVGIVITEGFNYQVDGLAVQRMGAQWQTYTTFIENHLKTSKWYIEMLHQWFVGSTPTQALGINERGTPISYWSVSQGRY